MSSIQIIWHRWAAWRALENSFASFQKAFDIGVDYIENDIWQLKDTTCVVFHDHLLDRVSDGTGRIDHLTFEQLQQYPLKNGEKIPTLDEYLKWSIARWVKTFFELKSTCDPLFVTEKILSSLSVDHFVMQSFFHEKVHTLKKTFPDVATGLLFEWSFDPLDVYLETSSAEYVWVWFESIDQKTANYIHASGKKLLLWTVDNELDITGALTYNPWWIISNKPDVVKKKLHI